MLHHNHIILVGGSVNSPLVKIKSLNAILAKLSGCEAIIAVPTV